MPCTRTATNRVAPRLVAELDVWVEWVPSMVGPPYANCHVQRTAAQACSQPTLQLQFRPFHSSASKLKPHFGANFTVDPVVAGLFAGSTFLISFLAKLSQPCSPCRLMLAGLLLTISIQFAEALTYQTGMAWLNDDNLVCQAQYISSGDRAIGEAHKIRHQLLFTLRRGGRTAWIYNLETCVV